MKERVVVTGLGAITPIGNNIEEFWNGIKAGKNPDLEKFVHSIRQILKHLWRRR